MHIIQEIRKSFPVKILMFYTYLTSGLILNLVQAFTLVLWPINKPLYRKANYILNYCVLSIATALAQHLSNADIELFMNENDFKYVNKENCIVIMNHKYDIDWLIGWILCQRTGLLGGSKVVSKSSLKAFPIIGWCWYFAESVFVKRRWEVDSKTLSRDLRLMLTDYPKGYYFDILILCEGTRFTEKKYVKSIEYAKANNLPILKHHLLPRSKGFAMIMLHSGDKINAIYDLTLGITTDDNTKPSLNSIYNATPVKGKFLVRRIPTDDFKITSEDDANEFIYKLYKEKDEIFDVFSKTGSYESLGYKSIELHKNYYDLYVTLFFIIFVTIPSVTYFLIFLWNGNLITKLIFVAILILINIFRMLFFKASEADRGSKYGLKEETKKSD